MSPRVPAFSLNVPSLRTSTPDLVQTDPTTRALCASRKRATTRFALFGPMRADFGATFRKPSVLLTQNDRSIEDCCAWSSVASITQRQRPSASCACRFALGLLGHVIL